MHVHREKYLVGLATWENNLIIKECNGKWNNVAPTKTHKNHHKLKVVEKFVCTWSGIKIKKVEDKRDYRVIP